MRIRTFIPVAMALLAATPLTAQQQRLFRDSWFWGAKGGIMSLTTRPTSRDSVVRVTAPTIGGEWLITRTQGALYVAFDQAFMNATTFVADASQTSGERKVVVKDLRRFTLGLMAFPKTYGALRPYVGAGVGITLVGSAEPQGTFSDAAARKSVNTTVNSGKSGAAPVLIGGLHADTKRVSFFAQGTIATFTEQFLMKGSTPIGLEFGVRYNLAPAKERPR